MKFSLFCFSVDILSMCEVNSILGQLDGVWRNRRLSLNTKLRLYTSLVQSVLLHGSETWTLTKADSARLQAFHDVMKAQRRILNIKWYDFVTNDSVRNQTKLTDLPHHSWQKILIAGTCLPPTTRCASPHPPALCQPLAGQMRCPCLEASTWPANEDLDTTGGRGSRVHNRRAVVIGAGSLVVEVATALAGQAQQWVSEWLATRRTT